MKDSALQVASCRGYKSFGMAGRQRGNTILISAILVLALTVGMLTITRLLTAQIAAQGPERELLGEQASALCLSGLAEWAKTNPQATQTYSDIPTPEATDSGAVGSPPWPWPWNWPAHSIVVTLTTSAPPLYTVSVGAAMGGLYWPGSVTRYVQATLNCPGAPGTPCSSYVVTQR